MIRRPAYPFHALASLCLGLALLAVPVAALAQESVAEPVVEALTEQGYTVMEIERTWLGRILITSRNERYLREVVLNRRSGAVIDDQLFALPDVPAGGQDSATDAGKVSPGLGLGVGDTGLGVGVGVGGGDAAGVGGIGGL